MGMFVERKKRSRKNVKVTVRNKNNKVTTDFQKLRRTSPGSTSRKDYKAPITINENEDISKSL